MHGEAIYRPCEIMKLLPALESQRGMAPVVELWIRCRDLPQGFLLNPGWGHLGTQITLEYKLVTTLRTAVNVMVGFISPL